MSATASIDRRGERLERNVPVAVRDEEYSRLLGYPRGHELSERARELASAARGWFAANGRPWIYRREVAVEIDKDELRLEGEKFPSAELREHLRNGEVERAEVVAVSAGAACEEEAQRLWREGKPDEYFFLETLGSAVVEQLIATASGKICDEAERDGWTAVPHYSPGYSGWNVADQVELFARIQRGAIAAWPEPLEVLSSGMLRPKKSLLAIVGLRRRSAAAGEGGRPSPCTTCSLERCQYRRRPYRHAVAVARGYTLNPRALAKWARERVRLSTRADGITEATFRYDGTTCSNQGRPLAFDYRVQLAPAAEGRRVLRAECLPAENDDGHRAMCAYIQDPGALMAAIASEKPLLGEPLDAVLTWTRPTASAGCYCEREARTHKWGLALEAIHYALAQVPANPAREIS